MAKVLQVVKVLHETPVAEADRLIRAMAAKADRVKMLQELKMLHGAKVLQVVKVLQADGILKVLQGEGDRWVFALASEG